MTGFVAAMAVVLTPKCIYQGENNSKAIKLSQNKVCNIVILSTWYYGDDDEVLEFTQGIFTLVLLVDHHTY